MSFFATKSNRVYATKEHRRRTSRRVQGPILSLVEVEVEPVLELEEDAEPEVGSIVLQLSVRQLSAWNSWPNAFVCTSSWQEISEQQTRVHVVIPPNLFTVTLQPWFTGATQGSLGTLASPALQASAVVFSVG